MSVLFAAGVNGAAANVTDYNNNWNLLEGSFADLGPYLISGLAVTSGAGLAVSVAAGVASIGGRVTAAGSFSIAGLTPSTTNHLYLLQNGAGTANTTGTQPALSVKLGTCVTGVAAVTRVSQTRSSGCQQQVRSENLIPGGPGGGHPASINLAGWAAAAGDGVPVFGVLPAGSLPATIFAPRTLSLTDTGTVNAPTLLFLAHRTSGVPASGFGGGLIFQFDNPANSLVTYGQILCISQGGGAGTEFSAVTHSIVYNGPITEVFRLRPTGMASAGGVGAQLWVRGDLLHSGTSLGFYNAATVAKQTLTGVKSGGTALVNLIAALVALGLFTDTTT